MITYLARAYTSQQCSNVSDANALSGLSVLLVRFDGTLWQGVKDFVMNWKSVIDSFHVGFGYRDLVIGSDVYSIEKCLLTDAFICKVRESLAQFHRNCLNYQTEIDMVYRLLTRCILQKVPRDEIITLDDFLREC